MLDLTKCAQNNFILTAVSTGHQQYLALTVTTPSFQQRLCIGPHLRCDIQIKFNITGNSKIGLWQSKSDKSRTIITVLCSDLG